MTERIGSDYGSASVAGISSDRGDALISADTTGSTALLFGPAAYRVIVAGVANGDLAMPPDDALAVLSDDNPLPFFTWNNSGGTGITAQVVANGTASSGNALRISIGTAVASGTATLERIEPITGTGDRGFTFVPQMTAIGTLNGGTAALADLSFSWLGPDQSTAVGTAPSAQTLDFASFYSQSAVTLSAGLDTDGAASIYNCAPVGASFLKMTATFRVTAAGGTATRTLDITDFAIAVGESQVYISEKTDVNKYGAALIDQVSGSVGIVSGAGTAVGAAIGAVYIGNGDASFGDPTFSYILADATDGIIDLFASSVDVSGDLTTTGDATIGGNVNTDTVASSAGLTLSAATGDIALQSGGSDVVVQDTLSSNGTNPRIMFRDKNNVTYASVKSGAANIVQILNGTSATDYAYLWAERIYPMNGSTDSRYIYDDGTRTAFSGGIDVNSSSTLTTATFSSTVISSSSVTAFSATGAGNVSLSGGGDVILTGADTSVPISGNGELNAIPNTTTLTTNSARWVLISGSTYGLRRDSSTRRVKTNIVEADDAVLAAAKNLRAVHYEALEKDNDGNVVPSGKHTLGLIAEEIVEAGLGCAVTYDGEGLPDGYDERVIIAALLHRVNDLEARLAALEEK